MTTHQPKSTHKSATILGHFLCNYPASSEGPLVLDFPGAGLKSKALAVGWVAGADYLKNPELGSAGASLQDTRAVFSRRGIPSRLLPLDLSLTPGAPQVSIPQPATALSQESFLQTWVISFPELKRPGTGALAGPRLPASATVPRNVRVREGKRRNGAGENITTLQTPRSHGPAEQKVKVQSQPGAAAVRDPPGRSPGYSEPPGGVRRRWRGQIHPRPPPSPQGRPPLRGANSRSCLGTFPGRAAAAAALTLLNTSRSSSSSSRSSTSAGSSAEEPLLPGRGAAPPGQSPPAPPAGRPEERARDARPSPSIPRVRGPPAAAASPAPPSVPIGSRASCASPASPAPAPRPLRRRGTAGPARDPGTSPPGLGPAAGAAGWASGGAWDAVPCGEEEGGLARDLAAGLPRGYPRGRGSGLAEEGATNFRGAPKGLDSCRPISPRERANTVISWILMVAFLLGCGFSPAFTKANATRPPVWSLIFDPVTGLCGHFTVKPGNLDFKTICSHFPVYLYSRKSS